MNMLILLLLGLLILKHAPSGDLDVLTLGLVLGWASCITFLPLLSDLWIAINNKLNEWADI